MSRQGTRGREDVGRRGRDGRSRWGGFQDGATGAYHNSSSSTSFDPRASKPVDVSASRCCKAFAPGGPHQSTERCRQGPGQTRTKRSVPLPYVSLAHLHPPYQSWLLVFRDQVLKHLENVPPSDFDAITNKLVQAGSTLEYLKYADALFEILLVGGLLQPGGQYVEDGTPLSPFSFLNAKEPVEVADMKQYVEVLNKLIRR